MIQGQSSHYSPSPHAAPHFKTLFIPFYQNAISLPSPFLHFESHFSSLFIHSYESAISLPHICLHKSLFDGFPASIWSFDPCLIHPFPHVKLLLPFFIHFLKHLNSKIWSLLLNLAWYSFYKLLTLLVFHLESQSCFSWAFLESFQPCYISY